MEMSGDERRLDIGTTQFAAERPRRGALPNRVLDIYDRRHQSGETQVALDHRKQRTNPSAIAHGEHAEFAGAVFAQCAHQLAQLHYALAQSFCVADEIAGDRKLTVPVPARDTRVMVWQLNEACVPAKLVEMLCATPIANRACGHQRMQNENRRCSANTF